MAGCGGGGGMGTRGRSREKKPQYSYEVIFFLLRATNEIFGAIVAVYSLRLSHSAAYETS